jgi:hypothetical protein
VRLEITEDDRPADLDADDPRLPLVAVYDWLTWLQDAMVRSIIGD